MSVYVQTGELCTISVHQVRSFQLLVQRVLPLYSRIACELQRPNSMWSEACIPEQPTVAYVIYDSPDDVLADNGLEPCRKLSGRLRNPVIHTQSKI